MVTALEGLAKKAEGRLLTCPGKKRVHIVKERVIHLDLAASTQTLITDFHS